MSDAGYYRFGDEAEHLKSVLGHNLALIEAAAERGIERALAKFAYLVLFNADFDIVRTFSPQITTVG